MRKPFFFPYEMNSVVFVNTYELFFLDFLQFENSCFWIFFRGSSYVTADLFCFVCDFFFWRIMETQYLGIFTTYLYVILLTPRKVASFFLKVLSFYPHYTFIGTTFIKRCQPVPVRFSGLELVAPQLESALDKQL